MEKWKRIVAANGKYVSEGKEKTRWVDVGTAFIDGNRNIRLKLDSVPVGQDWNGSLSLFDFDEQRRIRGAGVPAAEGANGDVPF